MKIIPNSIEPGMDLQGYLSSFFRRIENDVQINPTQISLYITLLCEWNDNHQTNPFQIQRRKVMRMSKISSRSTFSKSMKGLHESGYIKYIPSYNPEISSMVCLNV